MLLSFVFFTKTHHEYVSDWIENQEICTVEIGDVTQVRDGWTFSVCAHFEGNMMAFLLEMNKRFGG